MNLKQYVQKGIIIMSLATLASAAANAQQTEPTFMQKTVSAQDLKTALKNNPISAIKFTADPAVLVYNDTVYIYGTNDSQQLEFSEAALDNNYTEINTLNMYSSKDLVNWNYLGETQVGGWAHNSWAPAICVKNIGGKDKFFMYFADSARGIGVLTADSPEGPFTDPLGKALIDRSCPNMEGVWWLFDPAVLNDDDGKSYLYFGGGVQDDVVHPRSARCVELGEDMISIVGVPVEIDAPWLFEDSGINKFNGKYYYSYCSNWAARPADDPSVPPIASICYMTSDKPLGPFTYQGYTLINPNTGNDHHWIFEFKGKNYIAYHTQMIEKKLNFPKGGYRNLYINDFVVNEDGTLPIQKTDTIGVNQVVAFNPYETVRGSCIHNSQNIVVLENLSSVCINKEGYICIKGADLSQGINKFTAEVVQNKKDGSISVYVDNMESKPVATVKTKGKSVVESKASYSSDGKSHDIYIKLTGDAALLSWKFN